MVYVFLADGFELIEALAPVDMLRRAKIGVMTVGIGGSVITASCGVSVTCDISDKAFRFKNVDAIVLPGGMPGTKNLEKSPVVQDAIDKAAERNTLICAICAAPSILGHKGLLNEKEAICFPGFEEELTGATISKKHVVCDGDFITAKGAGVAVDFGLEIVCQLEGREMASNVRKTIQCP